MKRFVSIMVLCVFLMGFLAVFGCKEPEPVVIYVCENGREVSQKTMCRDAVKKTEAETYAKRYVGAYFTPYGGKAQLVSSHLDPEKGDYIATFIVAEKGGSPYETVVSIEGVTGKVDCTENCDYNK